MVNEDSRPCFATDRPFVIGVTGNIACGKSTVVAELESLGATAIDGDRVYHSLIEPGAPLWATLIERYGDDIVTDDRTIDRKKLGQIVFADPAALADLDRLTHPTVIEAIERQLAEMGHGIAVVEAIKLVESGLDSICDQLWVVTCEPEQQIERLMARNGLSSDEARQRVEAQPDLADKLRRADVIIDNSGSLDKTRFQVRQAWRFSVPASALDDAPVSVSTN
jgi:dephospho-CoA kinase